MSACFDFLARVGALLLRMRGPSPSQALLQLDDRLLEDIGLQKLDVLYPTAGSALSGGPMEASL